MQNFNAIGFAHMVNGHGFESQVRAALLSRARPQRPQKTSTNTEVPGAASILSSRLPWWTYTYLGTRGLPEPKTRGPSRRWPLSQRSRNRAARHACEEKVIPQDARAPNVRMPTQYRAMPWREGLLQLELASKICIKNDFAADVPARCHVCRRWSSVFSVLCVENPDRGGNQTAQTPFVERCNSQLSSAITECPDSMVRQNTSLILSVSEKTLSQSIGHSNG